MLMRHLLKRMFKICWCYLHWELTNHQGAYPRGKRCSIRKEYRTTLTFLTKNKVTFIGRWWSCKVRIGTATVKNITLVFFILGSIGIRQKRCPKTLISLCSRHVGVLEIKKVLICKIGLSRDGHFERSFFGLWELRNPRSTVIELLEPPVGCFAP